ncbi:MAG: diguanylate cyclase (GGDEF)-like protein [Kiritimatiellia bacterium]
MAQPKPSARTLVGPTLQVDQRKSDSRVAVSLPTVRVAAGPDMLKFATLYPPDGRVVVGRDATCDLTLSDGSVSRNHAALQVDDHGNIYIEDLGSTNGTCVNGDRVSEQTTLHMGDTLLIGGVTLRLETLSLKELAHLTKVVQRLSLANKDALTGLVTRHFLDEELPPLVQRHQVSDVPLACLFMDIDHFKGVNDNFGHGVGDEVLRTMARLMVIHVRDSDTCIRYGGEEFVAVLPNCTEQGALNTAERLREEVEAHDWSAYAEGLTVTLSVGISEIRRGEAPMDWIDRADKALYAAKGSGRNRSVTSSSLTPRPKAL